MQLLLVALDYRQFRFAVVAPVACSVELVSGRDEHHLLDGHFARIDHFGFERFIVETLQPCDLGGTQLCNQFGLMRRVGKARAQVGNIDVDRSACFRRMLAGSSYGVRALGRIGDIVRIVGIGEGFGTFRWIEPRRTCHPA